MVAFAGSNEESLSTRPAAGVPGPFAVGSARPGSEADRRSASLLLPRNVSAAAHHGTNRAGLDAGFASCGVFDGRLVVAATARFDGRRTADCRPRIRLRARLFTRRALGDLCVVPARRHRTLGARSPEP